MHVKRSLICTPWFCLPQRACRRRHSLEQNQISTWYFFLPLRASKNGICLHWSSETPSHQPLRVRRSIIVIYIGKVYIYISTLAGASQQPFRTIYINQRCWKRRTSFFFRRFQLPAQTGQTCRLGLLVLFCWCWVYGYEGCTCTDQKHSLKFENFCRESYRL